MIEILESWVSADRVEEIDYEALSFVVRRAIMPAGFVHHAHKIC